MGNNGRPFNTIVRRLMSGDQVAAMSPLIQKVFESPGCQSKYGSAHPAGATLPKFDPIRISPGQFAPASAYACVTVTVDESGKLVDARVVETDHAPLGEHLLAQAVAAHWRPAMLGGVPIASTSVVSASYGSSGP
jgi:hypothetical protein